MGALCGALTPHHSAERHAFHMLPCAALPPMHTLGCSLESSAPACPKAEAAAAIAIAAEATCAGPLRPAARTLAAVESPAGANSNMRVTVEC